MKGTIVTGNQQRAILHSQIWGIANNVRGAVDGWDFKQYVLGALFYRFISEKFIKDIEAGNKSVNYAQKCKKDISPKIIDHAVKTYGYFIYPEHLFGNVVKNVHQNKQLNIQLAEIFGEIESSANGYPSEDNVKGLFDDFDTTSKRLGNTVAEKNKTLAAVLQGVASLEFKGSESMKIDLFGDAYEYLISKYAANAGKSGGEFFTPQNVSKLIMQIVMHKKDKINKIYDPACGSGSLLLQAKKYDKDEIIANGYFGQEKNPTIYNLARMNMFFHGKNCDDFNIKLGDTLIDPQFTGQCEFDAIVSNPPYSVKWIGKKDPTLINDDRFAPAGVLAPDSKADFAFVLDALSHLSGNGRAAIVCYPTIFSRRGAEQKIRKYLIDNNYVEAVISLASNLFYGTDTPVTILVLAKNKTNTNTKFINASGEDFFEKETNNNVMYDEHIKYIMTLFNGKKNVPYVAESVSQEKIKDNDYNLSVRSYVETKDNREVINIADLNSDINVTVGKIDRLRTDINAIVGEIEK